VESEEGTAAPRLTATRHGEYHPRTLYASDAASDVPPDHHAGRVPYDLRFVARKAPVTPPR